MKIKAWLVRSEDNSVYMFYGEKPIKTDWGFWDCSTADFIEIPEKRLPEGINPRWEDEEPIELDITITRAKDKKDE